MDLQLNQSSSSSPSEFVQSDCLLAKDVVLNGFAQMARLVLLLFNIVPCILFVFLLLDYSKHRLALHANLKLIYTNIALINLINCISYLFIEFRHLYLSLIDPEGQFPCAMLCPLWYVLLTRGAGYLSGMAVTLLHLFAMLERWRATLLARDYEREGVKFGLFGLFTILAISGFLTFFYLFDVLADYGMDWDKLLAYNSAVTRSSNSLVLFSMYASLLANGLTALGDYLLMAKNRRMRRMAIALDSRASSYSLSENYQFHENMLAMRYILPLDLAFVLFDSAYCVLTIVLRLLQPRMPFPVFLANYNLIICLPLLYVIISLICFCHYLRWNGSGRGRRQQQQQMASSSVAPVDQLGQLYFQQLNSQWNGGGQLKEIGRAN